MIGVGIVLAVGVLVAARVGWPLAGPLALAVALLGSLWADRAVYRSWQRGGRACPYSGRGALVIGAWTLLLGVMLPLGGVALGPALGAALGLGVGVVLWLGLQQRYFRWGLAGGLCETVGLLAALNVGLLLLLSALDPRLPDGWAVVLAAVGAFLTARPGLWGGPSVGVAGGVGLMAAVVVWGLRWYGLVTPVGAGALFLAAYALGGMLAEWRPGAPLGPVLVRYGVVVAGGLVLLGMGGALVGRLAT
jgi:hypothetical protein